jgi:hypothetical protein
MSATRSRLATVAVATATAVSLGAAAAGATCASDEDTLFSCPSGSKRIVVCASKGWSPQSGYVQYRFGTRGQTELVVPEDTGAAAPAQAIAVGQGPLSGGGFAYVRFANGSYEYFVYSAISGRWGTKSGVAVDKDGARIAVRRCDARHPGEFGNGLIDREGLPRGDSHFELP